MFLGRTRSDLSVLSDLKSVRMPCCCGQRRIAFDKPLISFQGQVPLSLLVSLFS